MLTDIKLADPEAKLFNVSPLALNVTADATEASFNVSGNVAWTASCDNSAFTLSTTSGTGDAEVKVTFAANTSEEAKVANIKVSTTENASTKEYTVVLTQAKASSGAETKLYELDTTGSLQGTNNSYTGNCDVEVNGITWNVNGNTKINPWRLGGKSITDVDRTIYSKTPYAKSLTKIVLTLGTANLTVNSCKLLYSTSEDFADAKEVSFDYKSGEIELFATEGNFPANCYYKFVFNVTNTGSSNKYVQFSKVAFWGE